MNPSPPQPNPRRAWSEIPRINPPKRGAEERVNDFREIYSLYDEATIKEQASRCLLCPHPHCRAGCPLGNRIPEWISLAAEGKFLEAAEVSQSTSNMPELCSRVCPQERLCEGACVLNGRWDPVAIGAIERFINEFAFAHEAMHASPAPSNGFRVAVIGSGPGGIACADELAKEGFAVTVFESQSIPGGLLVNGIPAFKLEKSLVERRIDFLRARGVEFELGVTVGKDLSLKDLTAKFDAIFLGIGAQKSKKLDVPGAELKGVQQALPFLVQKNVETGDGSAPIEVQGKNVVVLGGGDTAMDCLRTALRCQASKAVCLYRRDFANMPGSRKEYSNALEEGAAFEFLTAPIAVEGNAEGQVTQVRCIRMALGEPDENGRRKPRPVAGSEFLVAADLVLIAYGFDPVPFPEGSDFAAIALTEWGTLRTDANQMTSVPGVFAGGDSVRGPSLVVHAVRDGRKAAAGIALYLAAKDEASQRSGSTKQPLLTSA